ncbi:MAG: hypothetical protein QXR24_04390 [Thermosphaera sp.]
MPRYLSNFDLEKGILPLYEASRPDVQSLSLNTPERAGTASILYIS